MDGGEGERIEKKLDLRERRGRDYGAVYGANRTRRSKGGREGESCDIPYLLTCGTPALANSYPWVLFFLPGARISHLLLLPALGCHTSLPRGAPIPRPSRTLLPTPVRRPTLHSLTHEVLSPPACFSTSSSWSTLTSSYLVFSRLSMLSLLVEGRLLLRLDRPVGRLERRNEYRNSAPHDLPFAQQVQIGA